jgi:hypothetical protein
MVFQQLDVGESTGKDGNAIDANSNKAPRGATPMPILDNEQSHPSQKKHCTSGK